MLVGHEKWNAMKTRFNEVNTAIFVKNVWIALQLQGNIVDNSAHKFCLQGMLCIAFGRAWRLKLVDN